ncbi:MAG: MATE family efflux transporter [Legionellales bacterium]
MNSLKNNFYPLLKLAIPLCMTGLLGSAIFFFETLFLARLGPDILAAGALASWLAGTIIVIIFGILSSINILVAHQHGANNKSAIALIAHNGLWLALLLTIPTLLLFWNIAPILLLLGQNETIVLLAKSYLHAWAWGLVPKFVLMALLEVIMGLGHMRIILLSTLFEVTLSIILSFLLIFGVGGFPAMGISGAGWGMSISSWITAISIIIFIMTRTKYQCYFGQLTQWAQLSHLTELLRIGTPMGFMYCIEVGFFFALTLFMGTFGAKVLAANQIVMQYNGLLIAIIFSIAQAVTVRMGHLLGANDIQAARAAGFTGVFLSGLVMSIAALFFWFFPTLIISTDFDVKQSKNAEIIQFATSFLSICALFQIFEAMRIAFFGALRALKDTRFTLFISILSFWGIALPLGYSLATHFNFGGVGLWWGMLLGALLSVPLLAWRFNFKIQDYGTVANGYTAL